MAAATGEGDGKAAEGYWRRLARMVFHVPEGLPSEYGRYYALARMGYPLGAALHGLCLLVFWHLDVTFMAVFNIFSVGIFLFASWLNSRGGLMTSIMLVTGEIVVHAALATLFVGFTSIFAIYIVGAMAIIVITPVLNRPLRYGLVAVLLSALLAVGVTGILVPPLTPLSQGWQVALFIFNISGFCLLLLSMLGGFEWIVVEAEKALQHQHERAEMLLGNILPKEIAARLKDRPGPLADEFSGVSILFADIVDFTSLSQELSPGETLKLLNAVFTDFDNLVDQYGLEKIKTIGDAYMVVAGLPQPRADHAAAIARLALEMRAVAGRHQRPNGRPLALRIGINSGPVVAGVIGHRKFAYDLWGDAVNVAARMESHGQAGSIQISSQTRDLLPPNFHCSAGQEIDVKGKGIMRTFYLEGREEETGE